MGVGYSGAEWAWEMIIVFESRENNVSFRQGTSETAHRIHVWGTDKAGGGGVIWHGKASVCQDVGTSMPISQFVISRHSYFAIAPNERWRPHCVTCTWTCTCRAHSCAHAMQNTIVVVVVFALDSSFSCNSVTTNTRPHANGHAIHVNDAVHSIILPPRPRGRPLSLRTLCPPPRPLVSFHDYAVFTAVFSPLKPRIPSVASPPPPILAHPSAS